jgi:hypothetical protein
METPTRSGARQGNHGKLDNWFSKMFRDEAIIMEVQQF